MFRPGVKAATPFDRLRVSGIPSSARGEPFDKAQDPPAADRTISGPLPALPVVAMGVSLR
jgi:hypothetical protein